MEAAPWRSSHQDYQNRDSVWLEHRMHMRACACKLIMILMPDRSAARYMGATLSETPANACLVWRYWYV
jgi:hypothetical protein